MEGKKLNKRKGKKREKKEKKTHAGLFECHVIVIKTY